MLTRPAAGDARFARWRVDKTRRHAARGPSVVSSRNQYQRRPGEDERRCHPIGWWALVLPSIDGGSRFTGVAFRQAEIEPSAEQLEMLKRIRLVLGAAGTKRPARVAA